MICLSLQGAPVANIRHQVPLTSGLDSPEVDSSNIFVASPQGTRPGKRLQKTMEQSTMLLMGKLTISTGPFQVRKL